MSRDFVLKTVVPLSALTGLVVYNFPPVTQEQKAVAVQVEQSVYYAGCNEVRALGKDPLYRGQPGYREGMDGDNDGIACEPYRGYQTRELW